MIRLSDMLLATSDVNLGIAFVLYYLALKFGYLGRYNVPALVPTLLLQSIVLCFQGIQQ